MKKGFFVSNLLIWSIVLALIITLIPERISGSNIVKAEGDNHELPSEENMLDRGKRSEVISKRTEKSKTYLNADETFTVEISEKPIHFKEKNNEQWENIDNTLIPNETGEEFVNKANSLKTEFTEKASEEVELVRIEEEETAISLSAVGATSATPSSFQNELTPTEGIAEGNEIVYSDLYPNVDVKYTVGTDRVKEDLILKQKPESDTPTSFSFAIDLEGLEYEEQEGQIFFTNDKTGEPAFYLEKPFMYDSFEPEGYERNPDVTSFAEGALSYDIEMELESRGDQLYVNIVPNREWLDSGDRVYPVIIDPTIVKVQEKVKIQDTNIRSHFPNNTGGGETTLGVGLYQDSTQTNKIRSLLKFDPTSIPVGSKVLDATLNLKMSSVWNDTPIQVDLHEVTNSWQESSATWSKRDGVNVWSKAGGDYKSTPVDSVGGISSVTDLGIDYHWNVPTNLVFNWIHDPASNKGILLKASDESIKSWKKFVSSDQGQIYGEFHGPMLAITYASASRIGLENYWTYDEHKVGSGKALVNIGTGNGVIHFNDFQIEGRGKSSISFNRTYNTKSTESESMGPGWSHTGSQSITQSGDYAYYTDQDGTTHEFIYNPTTQKYTGPPGIYYSLTGFYDRFELVDKFGNKSVFNVEEYDGNISGKIFRLGYQQDRNGNKIQYAYNDKEDITSVTDASGRVMSITQGATGISSVVFAGKKYTYHYNSNGQLSEAREYTSSTSYVSTFYTYNSSGQLETITDANGNQTKIIYNGEFVQAIQQPSPTGAATAVTSYQFDIFNRTSEVTDPNGGITKFTLNSNYGVKTSSNPLGKTVSQDAMDANFNTTQATDAEGNITKSLFDPNGNMLSATDAKGVSSTNTYDSFSSLKTATSTKGTTAMDYDPKGNLTKVTEADGNITTQAYDIYGNRKSTTASDGTQRLYAYDTSGNYSESNTDQIGRIKSTQTDSFGNVLSRTDAKGNITSFDYDQRFLLRGVTDANGGTSTYAYDGNENLLAAINALGKKTSYTYNGQDQLKTRTLPLGQITSFDYDQNGNLINLRKPNGTVIENEYNKANQLFRVSASGLEKWFFTYDGNGNVKTAQNMESGEVKTFDYDKNGNLELESKGYVSVDYEYNDANEMISLVGKSYQTSFRQDFTFNEVGKIKDISREGVKLVTFAYKPVGLPESVLYSNGVKTTFGFDEAQQLKSLAVQRGTSALLTESFNYDANGNIDAITSSLGNRGYTYDALNQLKSQTLADGTVETYDYDKVGNRLSKKTTLNGQTTTTQYSHNSNNQLTSVNGVSFSYDANGNRTKDDRFLYTYNAFDELQTVKTLSGQLVVSYKYDEQGRRISKNIGGKITNYHYGQGIEVLFETDSSNNIIAEYTYDQRGFPKTLTKNGQTYFYVLNGHYDVVALTNASGQTVASYRYDAWGNILSQSGTMATSNPYRYAGYRYDEETNHYYLIARYYNAAEGVFLARDAIAGEAQNPQTQNGYSYANNNPVMNYDPNGNIGQVVAGALIGLMFEVVDYLLGLAAKYGTSNIAENINYTTLFIEATKGAAVGATGAGIVKYFNSYGSLGTLGNSIVKLNLVAPSYLISNFSDYSGEALAEDAIVSLLSNRDSLIYLAIKSAISATRNAYD